MRERERERERERGEEKEREREREIMEEKRRAFKVFCLGSNEAELDILVRELGVTSSSSLSGTNPGTSCRALILIQLSCTLH